MVEMRSRGGLVMERRTEHGTAAVCVRGARRWLGRVVVLAVACLAAGGCGSGGGGAGEVVAGGPQQGDAEGLGAGGVGVVADDTGDGAPAPGGPDDGGVPGPGGPDDGGVPVPGGPDDGLGPVDDAGPPVEDVVLPGGYAELVSPEVVGGGLVLLPEPSMPVGLVNEVVDLCDDSAAFLMANRRVLGPGEEATEEESFQVLVRRAGSGVDCDEPGGNRYIYVGRESWTPAYPTAAEALAHWAQSSAAKWRPDGVLLGYRGMFKREFPLEARDEVVVSSATVSVEDGTVRGLVHNLSESLYARNVVVAAGDSSWRWPLTVQPGERAPFEIGGWDGGGDPADIAVSVTADMSTDIDVSRAFKLGEMRLTPQRGSDVLMVGLLTEPTSPPGLEQSIKRQTIDDLRAYFAIMDNDSGTVIEVVRVPVGFDLWYGDGTYGSAQVIPIESFPATVDDLPDDLASKPDHTFYFNGAFGYPPTMVLELDAKNYTNYDLQVWLGGAAPPPTE